MVRSLGCFPGGKASGDVVSGTNHRTFPHGRPANRFLQIHLSLGLHGTLGSRRITGSSAQREASETRGKFAIGRSISERPKEVRSRETFGHWELDTVVSSRGKSKGCVTTLIERKTRLYTAVLMPDRTALSMEIALGVAISQYPTVAFLTATADRGKEFACYANLEPPHNLHVYFADPYSSWQRGSMKMRMACYESFSQKARISCKLRMRISLVH